ncbi:hypothetical protein DOY81_000917, partial [Sarcophaga bullata]
LLIILLEREVNEIENKLASATPFVGIRNLHDSRDSCIRDSKRVQRNSKSIHLHGLDISNNFCIGFKLQQRKECKKAQRKKESLSFHIHFLFKTRNK